MHPAATEIPASVPGLSPHFKSVDTVGRSDRPDRARMKTGVGTGALAEPVVRILPLRPSS